MKISISILAVCLAQLTSAAPSFEKRAVSGYNGVANSGVRQHSNPPSDGYIILTFNASSGQP